MSTNPQPRDFLVVHMMEPIEIGTRFTLWPLHMTIVPWFSAPSLEDVVQALQPIAKATKPFSTGLGERDYFGPTRKLPVIRVKNTPELQKLHDQILQIVENKGWPIQGRYTGKLYSPHVTQKAGQDAVGKIIIETIYIAEALAQNYRQIVAKLDLKI